MFCRHQSSQDFASNHLTRTRKHLCSQVQKSLSTLPTISLGHMEDTKGQLTHLYEVQSQEAKLDNRLTIFSLLSLKNRVGLKQCSHFGEKSVSLKMLLPHDSPIPLLGVYIPKRIENMTIQKLAHEYSQKQYSQYSKDVNNPKVHQQMNG